MNLLITLLLLALLLIIYAIYTYNHLVTLRNHVDNQLSQIDIQLKRRYDLIPEVIRAVQEYAKHEKKVFFDVASARASLIAPTLKEKANGNSETASGLKTIFAIAENYPKLRANENYLNLQKQLKDTEGRIAFSRQFYNDSVMIYNNRIQIFPSNIIGAIFSFKSKEPFEFDETKEEKRKTSEEEIVK